MKQFFILSACVGLIFLSITVCYAGNQVQFRIDGINNEMSSNVTARLAILQKSYEESFSENSIQAMSSQGMIEVKKALQPFGYFNPIVHISQHQRKDIWIVSYQINIGAPAKINRLDLKIVGPGKNNLMLQNYVKNFPIKSGDIFTTEKYNKAKESFLNTANEEGYIKSFLQENKIYINPKSNQVIIVLHLQTNESYKFGAVNFSAGPYSKEFLRRFVMFNSNEAFSSQKLIKLQQQLESSNYFQQVQVTPDFEHVKNNTVPVNILQVPPKSKRYDMGVGYGSLTGPHLTAGLNFRRLTEAGEHFDAQLKLSSVLSSLAGKLYIPGKNPLTDQWILGANYQRFLPKNGSSTSGTVTMGYLKKLDKLQANLDMNYLVERYKVDQQPQEVNKLLYPNLNLFYTDVDDIIHPNIGKSFNIILRGASEDIFSSTNFLQSEIKAKYLFSPTNFSHIILRADLGYTVVHNIKNLPLSMRFFAGGLASIRGYKDSGIGPGRYLEVGSIEYQHHIKGNWTGALFYDAGTATDHWGKALSKSEGVGLIYQSMIGPIKLYGAKALDKRKPYSVEFSMGPEF